MNTRKDKSVILATWLFILCGSAAWITILIKTVVHFIENLI